MSATLLTPDRYDDYLALRARMIREEPAAFSASPRDDRANDRDAFIAQISRPDIEIWVVGVRDELVAASGVVRSTRTKTRHRAHLWGVYCAPEHRGSARGRAVVEACLTRARTWAGVELLAVSVSAHATRALALYESLGFERWGTEPDALRIGPDRYDEHHLTLRL